MKIRKFIRENEFLVTMVVFSWLAGFGSAFLFISGGVGDSTMTQSLLESYGLSFFAIGIGFVLLVRFFPKKWKID